MVTFNHLTLLNSVFFFFLGSKPGAVILPQKLLTCFLGSPCPSFPMLLGIVPKTPANDLEEYVTLSDGL